MKSNSYFLDSSLPFEVRDAHHRLVKSHSGSTSIELPTGLYTVEAMLPDGGRASQLVQILADEEVPLIFSTEALPAPSQPPTLGAVKAIPPRPGARSLQKHVPGAPGVAHKLRDLNECELEEEGPDGWLFVPVSRSPQSTPWVRFSNGTQSIVVSLPLNPVGGFPDNACRVKAFAAGDEFRYETSFHTERRVATAVQGMLLSGGVLRGANVIKEASNLLLGKYQDPSAAALGGLTLHRLGHLSERQDWVENLARDFKWIPDGRVLLAGLLANDPDPNERERGYRKLLEASFLRPLFTDGLSLLLEMLRRWPDRATWDERRQRLEAISSLASRVDWNALSLTEYEDS
ncbi:MAG: hypothetical protein ABW096_19035 [Candidatus Thiodiazotropha sp.]